MYFTLELASTVSFAQTPVSIREDSKPAVETLRAITKRIEECPKALEFEKRWGKKQDEIERYYEGPPSNVVWDVVAGNSVRAPYLAYVEFTVDGDLWVPDSARGKFSKLPSYFAQEQMGAASWHYRYEYDLGPSGLQLTRVLLRDKSTDKWVEPKRSVIAEHCWDAAARSTETKSDVQP